MNFLPVSLGLRRLGACACLSIVAVGGCAAPFMPSYLSGSRRQEAQAKATTGVDPVVAANDPKSAALRKALGQQTATPEEALAGVLDELHEIGAIDPAAQQQLMADLKTAKPEHYGLIVEQFHAALAYRRQLAEREAREELQLATDAPEAEAAEMAPQRLVSRHTETAPTVQVIHSDAPTIEPPTAAVVTSASRTQSAALTAASADVPQGHDGELQQAMASSTSPSSLSPSGGDWRAELHAAISDLQRTVRAKPATIAELHEHLRLRALQVVAGREEEAYRPIPGASPAQQDYWSKQLFAMAAYLNSADTLDDKQRAAAALVHLDDARAALAQLATLQIRNLAFVASVDGFGAYEPIKHAEFEPGAPLTIYAEVENFASTSTEQGYETLLATSYQVVDSTGRRIDGAQFPEVSDVCRGRRRDFHLQYGVTLPARMAPGEYRLELTITDQRSGKIGQASLPLEINAAPAGGTVSSARR